MAPLTRARAVDRRIPNDLMVEYYRQRASAGMILTEATADLAWTLILGVARRVAEGDRAMRAGQYPGWGPLYMLGGDVSGRTLGLVGPGRIALAVARRAQGFGMTILYHGRRPSPELDALGGRPVALDRLLAESDFVSLHVPLGAETRRPAGFAAPAAQRVQNGVSQ